MVIEMPNISSANLKKLLQREFPSMRNKYLEQFTGLFQDIQKKSESGQISTKSLDLRGLISAIHLMNKGLDAFKALQMGLVNKTFDDFEHELVQDVIRLRISAKLKRDEIFTN